MNLSLNRLKDAHLLGEKLSFKALIVEGKWPKKKGPISILFKASFLVMSEPKMRQSLLLVDDGAVDPSLIQNSVASKLLEKQVHLTLVIAGDGAKASAKLANQKFDLIIVNATVPRIAESGLQHRLETGRDPFAGPIYVLGKADPGAHFEIERGIKFALPIEPEKLIQALITDLTPVVETKKPAPHPAFAVDVRVINAIISSTTKVLAQFGMSEIVMGRAAPKPLEEPMAGIISSVLEIVSDSFKGQLSVSFDEPSYLEMVSGMLCEEQTAINDENRDAVGELNNIIFGNAKADLSHYGVALTIPKVVIGGGQKMVCPAGSASLRVPFQTKKGHFFIDLIAYPGH